MTAQAPYTKDGEENKGKQQLINRNLSFHKQALQVGIPLLSPPHPGFVQSRVCYFMHIVQYCAMA
jgi:hypothetical protein